MDFLIVFSVKLVCSVLFMFLVFYCDSLIIFFRVIASASNSVKAVVGCVVLKIELSGVPLERSVSSSGREQPDDDVSGTESDIMRTMSEE